VDRLISAGQPRARLVAGLVVIYVASSGYIDTVMAYALRSDRIKAKVAYSDERNGMEQAERIVCSFSNGRMILRRTRPFGN
jgi:hypothetical protein